MKYTYKCKECGTELTVEASMEEGGPEIVKCVNCSSDMRRLIQPPNVVYKSPGFYNVDTQSDRDRRKRKNDV